MNYRTISIIAAVVLAAGAIGYHVYRNVLFQQPAESPDRQGQTVSGGASSAPVTIGAQGSGKYTVETIPLPEDASGPARPELRRPITFSAIFSAEAQEIMRQKIEASIAALEKDPRVFEEWMNLAILRKTVDDYEGARQIWEFLTEVSPNQPGPYANLAALYAFELKDYSRAEKNFAEAIKKGPQEVSVYRNAYDFYRYAMKDDDRAKQMLREGIAQTQSPDLQYLLDHYDKL